MSKLKAGKKGAALKTGGYKVRITPETAEVLRKVAKTLFDDMKVQHHAFNINRPSMRVAIDFLVYVMQDELGATTYDVELKENIYAKMKKWGN